MPAPPVPTAARPGAVVVKGGFERYRAEFRQVTRRAADRFAAADWRGQARDRVERLAIYPEVVREIVVALAGLFAGERDERLWAEMKREYAGLMAGRGDLELAETFFNSVTRKVFGTVGVAETREFVHFGDDDGLPRGDAPLRTYPAAGATPAVVRRLLEDCAFGVPWQDVARDAGLVAREIAAAATAAWGSPRFDFLERLEPVFYRNKGAYLVGRVVHGDERLPFVLACLQRGDGVFVDAALLTESEVSIVFSFTRSYFHVELESPAGAIRFLSGLIPRKPISDLYNSIGYDRHGKTLLYRQLRRHVESSGERFEHAAGDRGLVMIVFTMPGFEIVFKVIRDRFGLGKSVEPEDVLRTYRYVAEHDRAGRLVEVQEFEHLAFARDRFEPGLLAELLEQAGSRVRLEGDQVVLRHVYTERRVEPLNLYLRRAPRPDAEAAVLDYGEALRDLAATNIFPGDLMLKNFGVTRHGRVVFYDYDELRELTDCEFRALPEYDHAGAGDEPPVYVGPRDIFPEELVRFVGFPGPLRELFLARHGDLAEPAFWNRLRERHRAGELLDLYPYRAERRFRSDDAVAPAPAGRPAIRS